MVKKTGLIYQSGKKGIEDMAKKYFFIALALLSVCNIESVYAKKTTVGGHFKLTLYDYSIGDRTFTDSSNSVQRANGARSAGISISRFTLLVMREIEEIFTVLLQPNFEVTTGATPRLGKSIGENELSGAPRFTGWHKAFMRIMIPYPLLLEVTGGIIFPRFTMDYGAELFFEEEYNGSIFSLSTCLGEMEGTGIELYRTFELGFASMPTYIYIMNGEGNMFHDNNDLPEGMIHIEPEIGPVRLFGSFLVSKYDDDSEKDVFRWSGGGSVTLGPVELRSEYAGGMWEESLADTSDPDAKPHGFYAKLFYQFASWGKLMAHYNYVKYNFVGTHINGLPGWEIYSTITPGIQIYVFDCLAIQLQSDIANWRRKNKERNIKDKLEFSRYFLGLRATF